MELVGRGSGGGGGGGGGGGDLSALLRLVLPAARSSGSLPRVAGVVTDAREDESAPLIPRPAASAPAPAPAPVPVASSDKVLAPTASPTQQELPPTVVDSAASGQGEKTDWMKRFKGLLVAYVFFVLPLILLFFPSYSKDQNRQILHSLLDNSEAGTEKTVVLVLFVVTVTAGVLGVLLAHIADGPKSTKAVGIFTLWIILAVLAFIDYVLLKTLPDERKYLLVFIVHFVVIGTVICCLWFAFVWPSCCCKVKCCCCQGDIRDDRSA